MTVLARWEQFSRKVINPESSATQREEMRLAFYAGCHMMMGLLGTMPDGLTDAEEQEWMRKIKQELVQEHARQLDRLTHAKTTSTTTIQ